MALPNAEGAEDALSDVAPSIPSPRSDADATDSLLSSSSADSRRRAAAGGEGESDHPLSHIRSSSVSMSESVGVGHTMTPKEVAGGADRTVPPPGVEFSTLYTSDSELGGDGGSSRVKLGSPRQKRGFDQFEDESNPSTTTSPRPSFQQISNEHGEMEDDLPSRGRRSPAARERIKDALKPNVLLKKYYVQHTWREIKAKKFNFAIGCFSCFLVVVVAGGAQTMLENAPAIVLQQAEAEVGQFDIHMTADGSGFPYINFTRATEVLQINPDMNLIAPRMNFNARVYHHDCIERMERFGLSPDDVDWRYLDPRRDAANLTTATCAGTEQHCLNDICSPNPRILTRIRLIDSEREKFMGTGRGWPFGKLGEGEAVMDRQIADLMGVSVGDTFPIVVDTERRANPMLTNVVIDYWQKQSPLTPREIDDLSELTQDYGNFIFLLKLKGTFTPELAVQKWGRDRQVDLVMEYDHMLPLMSKWMHPILNEVALEPLTNVRLQDFASNVVMNLPNRVDQYLDTNFDRVKGRVVQFSSQLKFYLGFPGLGMDLPILEQLEDVSLFTLYLGLILNIILVIMGVLSIMLLYSLLMVSIETRTFEMGVLRMVGMKRSILVKLLIAQALAYAIPAYLSGLFAAQIVTLGLIQDLENSSKVPLDKTLTPTALLYATILGLLMPFLACLFPIRKALGVDLSAALDMRHSKSQAVTYSIERSSAGKVSPTALAIGTCLFVFGFGIYYLLPLALLSFNLVLFFNIFFAIIIGMLFGLILLTLNFEHILERFTVFIFLFWEKAVMRDLVLKNLVSHRVRNRKTTIMYALALGFVLFITVAFQTEITSASYQTRQKAGFDMYLVSDSALPAVAVRDMELLAINNSDIIRDSAWLTQNIISTGFDDVEVGNRGLIFDDNIKIYAVTPNFFDGCFQEFLRPTVENPDTSASLTEQLYTVSGSQSALLGSSFIERLGLYSLMERFLFKLYPLNGMEANRAVHQARPAGFLDAACTFTFSQFEAAGTQASLMSFDSYKRIAQNEQGQQRYQSLEDLPLRAFMFSFHDSATDDEKDNIFRFISEYPVGSSWDFRDFEEDINTVNNTMDLVFSGATLIAIILSAFSLMASSFTNIQEQAKEIAVLRALGLTNRRIFQLYVYESFTLVMSASLQGVAIGSILGFTLLQQRVLFTQLPVEFVFPYYTLASVIGGAIIVSLLSSLLPIRLMSKKSIAQVMRTVL